MTNVLLVGLVPQAVDTSDPDLPPGVTHEKIAAGIDKALADMTAKGWTADFCGILPDDSAEGTIAAALAARHWDCVVIGAGLRMPRRGLALFERTVNAIHRGAPATPIAFNTNPEDTTDAAGRWVERA